MLDQQGQTGISMLSSFLLPPLCFLSINEKGVCWVGVMMLSQLVLIKRVSTI